MVLRIDSKAPVRIELGGRPTQHRGQVLVVLPRGYTILVKTRSRKGPKLENAKAFVKGVYVVLEGEVVPLTS